MTRPTPRLGTESETFARRVGAFLLDALLVGAVFGVLSGLVAALAFVVAADPTSTLAINAAVLLLQSLTVVAGLAYFVYTEGKHGQTLGKRALGLVVVTEDGDPIGYGDALVRNVFRVVDALPAFFLLGAAVILVTERGQRVGDLVADTIVVEVE
jgi:uncharacterized RDD family membrane protein YckC